MQLLQETFRTIYIHQATQSHKKEHALKALDLDASISDVWLTTTLPASETPFHQDNCELHDLLQKSMAVKQ